MSYSASDASNLLLLFDRPQEPVYIGKGDHNVVFAVQSEAQASAEYAPALASGLDGPSNGSAVGGLVNVPEITLPPLGAILSLQRDENFSLFVPRHRKIAGSLIDLFIGMRNVSDLMSLAVHARDRVNLYLFNYALSVALLHREDTRQLDLPSFVSSFPDKFVDSKVFGKARAEANLVAVGSRTPIEIPINYTASNLDPEHRLAYFREDLGVNLHHWHWHLVYPFEADISVVNKDRRGELFYYMHQQLIARYNFERLANNLARVVPFTAWDKPIEEAYFPKMNSSVSSRSWPARVENQKLSNIKREVDEISQNVDDLKQWKDRITSAIDQGFVRNANRQTIMLTEYGGIDVLGNTIEASALSPDRTYYGDLHNMGHVFIAYVHDPEHKHLESFGVMGDLATAMRDPLFYRWHCFIDNLFKRHKETLPTYPVEKLNNPGIKIDSVEIQSRNGEPNVINTFWQKSDVDMSRGMDFQPKGPIFVRFTHLQHHEFNYSVKVQNSANGPRMGTCRIFVAPKLNEGGHEWNFNDQRLMFVELDKFTVKLRQGANTISRSAKLSSVTIPFERTFRNLDEKRPVEGDDLAQFNFCGCGWPAHMLVPKGMPQGMPCQLFVMISNYDDDHVNQSIEGACNDAGSYCGIKDKLYPDRRSMGYPFDRKPRAGVKKLEEFITSNMRVQEIVIKFDDITVQPKSV